MRIDRLTLQNFRKFKELTIDLHPQFTLLVGNNGSGKTTILDALAISLTPALRGDNEARKIELEDGRLIPMKVADRIQFETQFPVRVKTLGQIGTRSGLEWEQARTPRPRQDLSSDVQEAVSQLQDGSQSNQPSNWPVIAYYGVTRSSLPADWLDQPVGIGLVHREDAYTNWLNGHISYHNLREWFYREVAWAGTNGGNKRPGYEVIRQAVFNCLPDADDLWLDVDQADLVCSIGDQAQPLSNLSDGQRMILAMVADIAIKAVTLNAHLLPAGKLGPEDEPIPRVLSQTPGVVLIDELDVHLHPSWQRRVAADLKRTFPSIQFVCTSHSPQVIGEVPPEQIRIIDGETVYSPEHSFGVDSSRILEEVMGTSQRNESVDVLLAKLARQISDDDFDGARTTIAEAETQLGASDPEITSARALMAFVEQK